MDNLVEARTERFGFEVLRNLAEASADLLT